MRFPALRMVIAVLSLGSAAVLECQQTSSGMPPLYRGVTTYIDGIFVTPVPNAPFVGKLEIVSHQKLPDGTERVQSTMAEIARSSSGRIHNERRQLVPPGFKREPRLLDVHLYDPNSRQNIFYNTATHIARESILQRPAVTPPMDREPRQQPVPPGTRVTDLGVQLLNGLQLTGTRRERVVPADQSGTGQPVTITDDYWYSPDLSIYMTIRHDDPRTGEQLVAVTQVDRMEPQAELMNVPAEYKVVDETPPEPVRALPRPAPSNQ